MVLGLGLRPLTTGFGLGLERHGIGLGLGTHASDSMPETLVYLKCNSDV